jgi:hypothetical protein
MASEPYRRLPGTTRGFLRFSHLWLGADHLLLVRTTLATESYRRFYFDDIRAVTLRRTNRRMVWGWVWAVAALVPGALAAVCAWFAMTAEGGDDAVGPAVVAVFLAVPSVVCLVAWVLNLAWGPTCVVHVQSPVQMVPLGPLSRERRARRVLGLLRAHLAARAGGA